MPVPDFKFIVEIAEKIAALLKSIEKKHQQAPLLVVGYLDAVQMAVNALGLERQHILTDARWCDIQEREQVNALRTRLNIYLHEDNIRPKLQQAIGGLKGCHDRINNDAEGFQWRNHDKEKAVKTFTKTLQDLENFLEGLVSNFYPGGSGIGVEKLGPILDKLEKIESDKAKGNINYEARSKELGDLVQIARQDDSNEDWISHTGKIEQLIAKLQLAFSVRRGNFQE